MQKKYLDPDGTSHLISKIKTLLNGKSDKGHKHTVSDITDFPDIPSKLVARQEGDVLYITLEGEN